MSNYDVTVCDVYLVMLFNVSLSFKQLGVVQLQTNLFQYLRRLSENNEQHLAGKKTTCIDLFSLACTQNQGAR